MQIKYKTNKQTVAKETSEGRKKRSATVYTKAFYTKQKFGAASPVRTIYKKEQ